MGIGNGQPNEITMDTESLFLKGNLSQRTGLRGRFYAGLSATGNTFTTYAERSIAFVQHTGQKVQGQITYMTGAQNGVKGVNPL